MLAPDKSPTSPTTSQGFLRSLSSKLFALLALTTITAVLSATAPAQNDNYKPAAASSSALHQPILAAGVFDFFKFLLPSSTLVVDDDMSCPGAAYSTIQAAVTAASDGDTITVCAGTYNENVNVNKSLIINGPQVGIDARTRTGQPEAIVDGQTTGSAFVVSSGTVTINGFTFSGTGSSGSQSAIFLQGGTNHIISNNIFDNTVRLGSYLSSPETIFEKNRFTTTFGGTFGAVDNTTVQNNLFDGMYDDAGGAVNTSLSSNDPQADNFKILNNQFTATTGNFAVVFVTNNGLVDGNTVTGTDSSSIFIGGGNTNLTVSHNTIKNGTASAVSLSGGFGYPADTGINILSNNIEGNLRGIRASTAANSTTGIVANYNRIKGNSNNGVSSGIVNDSTAAINAKDNFFGCDEGPSNPLCDAVIGTGPVTAEPHLMLDVIADSPINNGATSTITARFISSDPNDPYGATAAPVADGILVNFSGAVTANNVPTVNGVATTTFTDTSVTGNQPPKTVTGTADNGTDDATILVMDMTAPTVQSVNRATGEINPRMDESGNFVFTVTFSEAVTGVDSTDFSVTTTGGITGTPVISVSADTLSATRTVTVSGFNNGNVNGTIRLNVLDDDTIVDVVSNPLNGGFTNGQFFTILMTNPTGTCDNDVPRRVYDVVSEFSLGANPNCEFTYGNTPDANTNTISNYTVTAVGAFQTPGIDGWFDGSNERVPGIYKNNNGSPTTYNEFPSVVQPNDVLNLHPGTNGKRSVLRFTVPTGGAGAYNVGGRFTSVDANPGATTDVSIFVNGVSVFSNTISGVGSVRTFSLPVTLADGNTVDFRVGDGGNGFGSDSTGLAATLTPIAAVTAENLYGLSGTTAGAQQLVMLDSSNPNAATAVGGPISGLAAGETLLGIDFRPATGQLYGLGSTSRLYTINTTTGAAAAVGSAGAFTLNGTQFGFDFNPTVDRIRVVSNTGQNLRLNPNNGALVATDGNINGGTPNTTITAAAYTNNVSSATATTLYDIDTTNNTLYIQNPPNNGTLTTPVTLTGATVGSANGFDISGSTAVAYASFGNQLYSIDLATGAVSPIGAIGAFTNFTGLTSAPVDVAPIVRSITRLDPDPTNASSVRFLVTFSEAVTNVDAGDFQFAASNAINGLGITNIQQGANGDPNTYTVTVSIGMAPMGTTLRLDLIDNDSIVDAGGTPLGGMGMGNGSFTTGQFYTIDKTAPTPTISQANGQTDPTMTSPINFTVNFGEPVTMFDASDIVVSGTAFGAGSNKLVVVTGSGGVYNVAVSGMNQNGTVIINFAAGAAVDAAGNGSNAPMIVDNTVTFMIVNTTVQVTPVDTMGWFGFNDTNNRVISPILVEGPATPPLGIGSERILTDPADGPNGRMLVATEAYRGTRLDQITTLKYSTYVNNPGNPAKAPSLQIGVDFNLNAPSGFQGRLIFEPYQNGTVVQQQWQTWDANNGLFYTSRGTINGNPTPCPQATPCTRAQLLAAFPNVGINSNAGLGIIGFRGEGSNPTAQFPQIGFDGNVDAFIIGVNSVNKTFDFEPTPPTVSIDDAATPLTQNEGNSGTTAYNFVVRLSQPTSTIPGNFPAANTPVPVSAMVTVKTADGTATTADNDYQAVNTVLTFDPTNDPNADGDNNPLTQTVTVLVNGDTKFEMNESFTLNLSNAVNTSIVSAANSRTGTITNDDTAPTISISDANPSPVTEGNTGSMTPSVFTVSLSNASDTAVTVSVTPGGTAASGTDFTLAPTTLTFAPGETTKTVTATIIGDTIDEADETFTATIAVTSGTATVAQATGTGTIADDDSSPTFAIDDVTHLEGDSGTTAYVFTVTKTGATEQISTVNFATADGSATAGSDYAATSGTLTFAANQTTQTVTVQVNGDILVETDETFFVQLSSATNGAVSDNSGTGTITNDDANPTVTITPVNASTSTSPVNFTVTFSRPVTGFGDAPGDVIIGGTAFGTGSNSQAVVTGSGTTYNVAVSGMNQSGTVTISVPAGAAVDSAGNPNDASASASANFTLTVTAVTVNPTNTLTPGITMWNGFNDNTNQLTPPSYVEGPATPPLGTGSARLNTDANGKFLFFSTAFNGTPLSQVTELSYGAYANDPTNQANLPSLQIGIDYDSTDNNTGFQGRLVFIPADNQTAPNQAIVPMTWQRWDASNGRFGFTQGPGAANCGLATPCALSTILAAYPNINIPNNAFGGIGFRSTGGGVNPVENYVDAFTIGVNSANTTFNFEAQPPTISVNNAPAVAEGNTGTTTATFTVTQSVVSQLATTVIVNTADGTATTADGDYVALVNQTVTIPAGQTSATFTVTINGDMKFEPNETFTVNLSNAVNAAIVTASGTGTINNDDVQPTVSVVNTTPGAEPGTANVFTVTLSGQTSSQVTVQYATADGTATAGSDYTTTNGTLTFAPNASGAALTQTISVPTLNDNLFEGTETFTLGLSNPTNATISGTNPATGTIADDDTQPTLQFSSANYAGSDSATNLVTINVTRSGAPDNAVSVQYATGGGSATGGASCTTGVDYITKTGTLNFAAGVNSQSFTVQVCGDNIIEGNETVGLTLSNPQPTGFATLGTPSTATLTISDGAAGGGLSISGTITPAAGVTGVNPGVTVTLSGVNMGTLTTTTAADGSFTFSGLQSGNNYLVTPSKAGFVFDPIDRSYANLQTSVTNANFTAYASPIGRNLRIVTSYQLTVTGNVTVPVVLDSLGNENALTFSLNYDPTKLSNPTVACGSDAPGCTVTPNTTGPLGTFGIEFVRANDAMNNPTVFTAGNGRQVVTVTFTATPATSSNTPVNFGDNPDPRDISDVDGNSLAANYINGTVVFAQGLEGDVASRFTGNGALTGGDITVLRDFISGAQTPDPNYNEFQRADVAPAGSKGNGILTSSDLTVLRNYIANQTLTAAGGPSQQTVGPRPASSDSLAKNGLSKKSVLNADAAAATGDVRVVSTAGIRNMTVTVPITLDSNGTENGISFSISFDQTRLSNPVVNFGSDVPPASSGSFLTPNTTQVANGRLGITVNLPQGATFNGSGTKQVVTVTFNIANNAPLGDTPITFGNSPQPQDLNNNAGDTLPTNFVSGAVNIQLGPTAAPATVGGKVMTAKGISISQAVVTLSDGNGKTVSTSTNSFGNFRFDNVESGKTYVVTINAKRYTFKSQVLNLTESLSNLQFTSEP